MKRILVLVLVAGLFGACHSLKKTAAESSKDYALVKGTVKNQDSPKVYVQIFGNDKVEILEVDDKGNFEGKINMNDFAYARICNGKKAAIPAYIAPGVELSLTFDVAEVKNGNFSGVKVKGKDTEETEMMVKYYQKQIFPQTQELFVLKPVDFRNKMTEITAANEKIVDDFVSKNKGLNPEFVRLFKLQIQVPLASSYFYYPMYHNMMAPNDKSEVPADFNIFDDKLPKNDVNVYSKVYRYKTYEVSYWNNYLLSQVAHLQGDMEKFFSTYMDKLEALKLNQMIQDDIANNLIFQNYKGVPDNIKEILKKRYKELIKNPQYLSNIEKLMNE